MGFRSATVLLCLIFAAESLAQETVEPSAIFVMQTDGSDIRRVAEVKDYSDHASPRWSHDGKRLAFDARLGADGERACFVVGMDGAGLREVAKGRFADWSPDENQIAFQVDGAAGSADLYVQNLDGQGRVKIAAGHGPRWSSDGSALLYATGTMLRAIDLISSEEKDLLPAPHGVLPGFAWSPDGNQIAVVVGSPDDGVRHLLLVDPSDPKKDLGQRLKNKMEGSVSYSPDGKQLVFSETGELYTLDVAGADPPEKIAGQEGKNWHPAFSPDGQWIAFASSRRTPESAAPLTAATGRAKKLEEFRRHEKRSVCWSLDFTPDSRNLVMGGANGAGVQVWDVTTGETRDLGGSGMLLQLFPDGQRFATSWVRRTAHVINVQSGEVLREIDHGGTIWSVAVSRDGRRLLTGGLDKVIRIWDADSGESLVTFAEQPDYIIRATFSPDGREVIAGRHDQTVAVFDTMTGKQRLAIEHPAAVWGLAVSADGNYILSGTGGSLTGSLSGLNFAEGPDNVLRMWDRETGKLIREMKGHEGGVFCIDVSPDGRLAVTGSSDGTMRLWDLSTGEELSKIGPGKGVVACVRFSPDSKLVVAGGGVARIQGETIEFPNEQIRVYKVLDTENMAAAPAKKEQ
ncbi:MAG: hypothetical protein AB7O59_07930 [Pirellulales bacterium]